MIANMDSIQFESQSEIANIMIALQTYRKDHPRGQGVEETDELISLLNKILMEW